MCNPPAFMRVRTPPPLLYMDVIPLSSSSCTSSPFSTCFSSFSDLYIVHATLYIAKQHRQECWSNVHCQRRSRFSPFHFILSEPHSLVSLWVEFSLSVWLGILCLHITSIILFTVVLLRSVSSTVA